MPPRERMKTSKSGQFASVTRVPYFRRQGASARRRGSRSIGAASFPSLGGELRRFLAGPATEGETILYADLDFDLITDMKMIVDSAGHYARPDVVRLHIDRRPQRPLVIEETDANPSDPSRLAP